MRRLSSLLALVVVFLTAQASMLLFRWPTIVAVLYLTIRYNGSAPDSKAN